MYNFNLKIMKFLVFLLLFSVQILIAQNLVLNYSFEKSTPNKLLDKICQFTGHPRQFNDGMVDWITFNDCTPDLFVYDSTQAACLPLPKPRTGKRMLGLILYHPKFGVEFNASYHEFVQGKLAKPMQIGKNYRISFWVYNNDSLGVEHLRYVFGPDAKGKAVCNNNFSFYFSKESASKTESINNSIVTYEITPQVTLPEIVDTDGKWTKIVANFKADQAYKYFIFGNFLSDNKTQLNMSEDERQRINGENTDTKDVKTVKTKRIGYYLFDDFAIIEGDEVPKTTPHANLETTLKNEKKYSFDTKLLFEIAKADLKPEAQPILDELVVFLQKNTTAKIEICGYTDAQGEAAANLKLSNARAKSVYNFLISKGIDANQLASKGYGEANPVADNETETGRSSNRRVEILVKNL
jgi:OmpA-OmpF porin, OOP family